MNNNFAYLATLYIFGEFMTVIGHTEDECREAIRREIDDYTVAYHANDAEKEETIEQAMNDLYIRKAWFGTVDIV